MNFSLGAEGRRTPRCFGTSCPTCALPNAMHDSTVALSPPPKPVAYRPPLTWSKWNLHSPISRALSQPLPGRLDTSVGARIFGVGSGTDALEHFPCRPDIHGSLCSQFASFLPTYVQPNPPQLMQDPST